MSDIVEARIVCNFIDDIYLVLEKIRSNKEFNIIEEKDYIDNPKESGYRGYHLIIEIPAVIDGRRRDIKCEIQIRTSAMDFWATSEHSLNYKEESLYYNDKVELKRISDELWNIDIMMNMMAKKKKEKEKRDFDKVGKDIDVQELKNYVKWRRQSEIYE